MDLLPIHPRLDASDIPPERLAGNSQLTEEQKIGEVTRQFEALLLRQILAETLKPVVPSEYTGNSFAAGIYRDMVTAQLADSISRSGVLGLATTLERDFTRQLHAARGGEEAALPDTSSAQPDRHALTIESARAAAAFANHERTPPTPH